MARTLQSPGAFLSQLLEKHNLNPFKLSKDIRLSQSAVRLIVLGETRISVPVALRLAKYFNTDPECWLIMQMKWDLAEASNDKALKNTLKSISRYKKESSAAKKPAVKKTASKKSTASKKTAAKKSNTGKYAIKKKAARRK
ncbi:MAG: HigA family addiction module antitoxin [Treponema sp.]|nr:HigA family addiction module antitoxin [Treponema sp.]